jgi:hypothetical protein
VVVVVRRFGLLVLGLCVVLVVGVVWVAGASAAGLPTALAAGGVKFGSDATSTTAPIYELSNGNKWACATSTTGTSEEETGSTGTFHIKLVGCVGEVSGIKAKCTGLGDSTTGEILLLGKYDLVYDTGGSELGVAILFLVGSTHFTCAGLFLNTFEGTQLCLILEPYVEKTLHEIVCIGKGGKQEETLIADNGETVSPLLTVTEGENAKPTANFKLQALLLWLNLSTKENVKVVVHMT